MSEITQEFFIGDCNKISYEKYFGVMVKGVNF